MRKKGLLTHGNNSVGCFLLGHFHECTLSDERNAKCDTALAFERAKFGCELILLLFIYKKMHGRANVSDILKAQFLPIYDKSATLIAVATFEKGCSLTDKRILSAGYYSFTISHILLINKRKGRDACATLPF